MLREADLPPLLQRAHRALAAYDRLDLLQALGALQLEPRNAHSTGRFEFLTHVAASVDDGCRKPAVQLNRLSRLCNDQLITGTYVEAMEDPQAYPFVETVGVYGRNFRVVNGAFERVRTNATLLAQALWLLREEELGPREVVLVRRAEAILLAGLTLSDAMAERAGLEVGLSLPDRPYRQATVPPRATFERLRVAIRFSKEELQDLLSWAGLPTAALSAISCSAPPALESYTPDVGPLLFTPLIEAGDDLLVALPSAIVPAACHAAQALLCGNGLQAQLGRALAEAGWSAAVMALGFAGNDRVAVDPGVPAPAGTAYGLFSLDQGKLLYLLFISDPLDHYDPRSWLGGGFRYNLDLGDHFRALLSEEVLQRLGVEELFVVVTLSTVRNFLEADLGEALPDRAVVGLSLDHLETLCMVEHGQPLRLYRFVEAQGRVQRRGVIMAAGGIIDTFAMYRSNGYSFYMSDRGRPDSMVIQVGWGRELREEVQRKWNPHLVLSAEGDAFITVHNFYQDEEAPLYAPIDAFARGETRILVEGLGRPVWVTARAHRPEAGPGGRSEYFHYVEMVAYWLWQFTPALRTALDEPGQPALVVELNLAPAGEADAEPHAAPNAPYVIETDPDQGLIRVALSRQMEGLLATPDNAGERQLMGDLLTALSQMAGVRAEALRDISAILDAFAPLGLKKKMFLLDGSAHPDLLKGDLPRARTVQDEPVHELLDLVGEHLVSQRPPGSIPETERSAVLNDIVGLLFRRLVSMVDDLNPEGLLEALLLRHEALIRETALHRRTLPTQLACFTPDGRLSEEVRRRMREYSRANLASRFLVEYAVTARPSGGHVLNDTRYDELLALSMSLTDFGFTSDFIYYRLADIPLRVLPSHRLGQRRETLDKAMEAYASIFDRSEVARATASFSDLWIRKDAVGEEPTWREEVDRAALFEIGHSVTEILSLLVETINISPKDVNRLPREELGQRLAERLGWTEEKVASALAFLTLGPRADYLKVEPPYAPPDVLPWRFNRRLSLLQKPFLLVAPEHPDLVWGIRSVHQAGQYLGHLFQSGRYRATSKELLRAFSAINNAVGAEFNRRVEALVREAGFNDVEIQVRKLAGLRLQEQGQDLGDIDVMVLDHQKRVVWLLECKDLASARTPAELSLEMDNVIRNAKGKSIIEKHGRRFTWFKTHKEQVLGVRGIQDAKRWKVRAVIVVDTDLMTSSFVRSPMPIVPASKLGALVGSGRKSVLKSKD